MLSKREILVVAVLALILLGVGSVLAFLLLRPPSEPAPTLVSTAELMPTDTAGPVPTDTAKPIATDTAKPVTEDAWPRIQAASKMVVGTAADYPPFSYYTPDFKVDGFDVALIREIGQRLGVDVEIKDMAFEGLGGALQLNQIDVAIAALSVTPEREAVIDFTTVYYVGEDAILASEEAQIVISSVEEMAGFRVGVQRATVYEDWLRTSLVGTGLMPENDLLVYGQIEQAVRDVMNGRVDLVVLDLLPAQVYVQGGSVKIVGQGLNRQRFAIALPQGAASLQRELNRALTELQNEGRVAELVEQYLGLEESPPIPTPEPQPPTPTPQATPTPEPQPLTPTPQATVTPSCINGMTWVKDLSFDDAEGPPEVAPGQAFEKGWRVRNSGTCAWDNSFSFAYSHGNVPASHMGGVPVAIAGQVPSGAEYDIKVNLVAPQVPGVYWAFWQMRDGRGVPFGDSIWVRIRVPAPATATPAPTQTPSPYVQFSADRIRVKAGERVVFEWEVENVNAAYFYAEGEPWQDHGVIGKDKREVYPQRTTIYNLRVVKRDNSVEIRQIRIEVEPVVGAPIIDRFTVNPEFQITVGQCVDILWQVQGDVRRVNLLRNNVPLWDGAPISGTTQDCPPGTGEMAYVIEAVGPGGTSRLQRVVNVVQPTATPVPATPTPTELPPTATPTSTPTATLTPTELPPTATPTPTEATPTNPLAGRSWQMTSYYDGQAVISALAGTEVTAVFGDDGSVSGSAGCNTYNATYQADGNSLTVGSVTATRQTCSEPEGIMEQESAYLVALESATAYQIEGDELELTDAEGVQVATFTVFDSEA
jgi:polar amino acid transport system substrate-binding protein